MKGKNVKYDSIPQELRSATVEYIKLQKSGKPVPDRIRELHNKYKRWVSHGGKNPDDAPDRRLKYASVPRKLRDANSAYYRKVAAGDKPTEEERAGMVEYRRWLRHKGNPPKKTERPDPAEAPWPLSAHLEWERLKKQKVAPGDIPKDISRGHCEYMGRPVQKYTKCEDSDDIVGRGCRGRHGNGPRRLRFTEGVAACTNCEVAYRDVPDDVQFCGCCGMILRRSAKYA